MALGKDYESQRDCTMARGLELVGERWTMLILRDCFYGVRRYSDFFVHLGLPRAVLSERLANLCEQGVLEKRRYQDAPPREEYVLTEMGEAFWPVLAALGAWTTKFAWEPGRRYRTFLHDPCETRLVAYAHCPSCDRAVPAAEVRIVPGPDLPDQPATDPVSVALRRGPKRLLEPLIVTPGGSGAR
ncbi:ArsR family transcriptional regulator [Actinorhabdospora filicis]|uniref:ArsR family transcriptional regulator n=1 Tax=Actinorhabdospora filicis TaxID=1785913 RepID=A0A9W6SGC9_9ACTN|nr:helix-turn-helix domain-containing protein [Actinorhabdospora filicis]GLZ76645.1 ArsR family transcriptional regulator [Actinorhabdospora filicis]